MNLQAQIQLITVPQEFTRLCNTILAAEYGDDYLPIDDDRPDRGNDGYVKSEQRLFAGHCFKRVQNQSLDASIRAKMIGDLGKAITLKTEGIWDISAWTFLSNYPISEAIGARIVAMGKEAGIDVAWKGPDYLADALQRHKDIRSQFPDLHASEISEQLSALQSQVGALAHTASGEVAPGGVPCTGEEQRDLLLARPGGWEYLLFAGVLKQGKEALELKWRDHELHYPARQRRHIDDERAFGVLSSSFSDLESESDALMRVFASDVQEQAFGPPGTSGDPVRIEHFAQRILATYEAILDWAAAIRGTVVSDVLKQTFELTALLADRPAADIRGFIDRVVSEAERIPAHIADENPNKAPLTIDVSLVLAIDDDALAAYQAEMRRAAAALGLD